MITEEKPSFQLFSDLDAVVQYKYLIDLLRIQ